MMVIAPLLLIGLIYFAFSGALGGDAEMPAISVGFVTADSLPADAPLDQPLGENIRSMFFDESVRTWLTARDFSDEAAVRAALNQRRLGWRSSCRPVSPGNFWLVERSHRCAF